MHRALTALDGLALLSVDQPVLTQLQRRRHALRSAQKRFQHGIFLSREALKAQNAQLRLPHKAALRQPGRSQIDPRGGIQRPVLTKRHVLGVDQPEIVQLG